MPLPLGVLASLVLVLCGCGEGAPGTSSQQPTAAHASQGGADEASSTPGDSDSSGPTPSGSTPSRSTGPAPGRPPRISVKRVASYSFAAPDAGWVTMAGSGIAFTTTVNGLTPNEVDTVRIMKPGDRQPTVVFTGARGGVIEGVVGGKNYVVWTYEASQQEDPTDDVPWTIYAYDLQTGTTRVVQSRAGSPAPPWSSMDGDQIAWADYRGLARRVSDLYVADLRRHTTRRVVSAVPSGQVALSGTTLIYNKTVVMPTSDEDLGKSDLFALDLRTGTTRRLTYGGQVDVPTVAGPWLAWQNRTIDDSTLGAMNLTSAKRTTLDVDPEGFLTAGPGFAAYMGQSDGVSVIPLGDRARPIQVPDSSDADLCVPCGISVSGSRMTWGIDRGHGRFRVNVGDVRLEPSSATGEDQSHG